MRRMLCALALMMTTTSCSQKSAQAAEQQSPASRASVPVMDLHVDTLNRLMNENEDMMTAPDWVWSSIPKLEAGNVRQQVFSVWVDSQELTGLAATERALQMIDFFNQEAAQYSDHIALARNMKEADAINASGRIAGFLWMEGGAPINDDLSMLRNFQKLGIVGMTLTWSNNLNWAGSSTDPENPQMGLTDFGREVVREMNRLGMIVDVSHVSDQTFWDAIEVSTDPVIMTHSGCRALSDHPRNATDEMIAAVGKKGGVVGIVAYPTYLVADFETKWDKVADAHKEDIENFKKNYTQQAIARTGKEPPRRELMQARIQYTRTLIPEEIDVPLSVYIDHIEHAMKVAGPEHVAVGCDFDGIWITPKGFEDSSEWQVVAQALRERGHSEEVIRGVLGENARRVFRQVLK